jgi:proline iminopeptidase
LGAAYAEAHPERVTALVLAAFSTGTACDVDWLTVHAGRFFPAEWTEFVNHIPSAMKSLRVVEAYHDLLMDVDPAIRIPAAAAWCKWENAHVATTAISRPTPRFEDPKFQLGFARQVTYCWRHNNWLSENQIVVNADRLADIPGWLIHGRLDLSGPLDASWNLHQAWPGSKLIIVDDEGHGGPKMAEHWIRILNDLANNK